MYIFYYLCDAKSGIIFQDQGNQTVFNVLLQLFQR